MIGSDLDPKNARRIAGIFSCSGMPASTSRDVIREIWSKAAVSACINPTTAILRIPNGRLLESPVISRFVNEVCDECVAVARKEGIRLDVKALRSRIRLVSRNTKKNFSSMLQDVEWGRRTEISQINGVFFRTGERHGVATPLNRVLTAMVEAIEEQAQKPKG